jgi:hypothetical protein
MISDKEFEDLVGSVLQLGDDIANEDVTSWMFDGNVYLVVDYIYLDDADEINELIESDYKDDTNEESKEAIRSGYERDISASQFIYSFATEDNHYFQYLELTGADGSFINCHTWYEEEKTFFYEKLKNIVDLDTAPEESDYLPDFLD